MYKDHDAVIAAFFAGTPFAKKANTCKKVVGLSACDMVSEESQHRRDTGGVKNNNYTKNPKMSDMCGYSCPCFDDDVTMLKHTNFTCAHIERLKQCDVLRLDPKLRALNLQHACSCSCPPTSKAENHIKGLSTHIRDEETAASMPRGTAQERQALKTFKCHKFSVEPWWQGKLSSGTQYCKDYVERQWCKAGKDPYGAKWKLKEYGPFSAYARDGLDATQACCDCGDHGGCNETVEADEYMHALTNRTCMQVRELGFERGGCDDLRNGRRHPDARYQEAVRRCGCSCPVLLDRDDSLKKMTGKDDCKSLYKKSLHDRQDFQNYVDLFRNQLRVDLAELCPQTYASYATSPPVLGQHPGVANVREACLAAPAGCCRLDAFGSPEKFSCVPPTMVAAKGGTCATHRNSTLLMPLGNCTCPTGWVGEHCEQRDPFIDAIFRGDENTGLHADLLEVCPGFFWKKSNALKNTYNDEDMMCRRGAICDDYRDGQVCMSPVVNHSECAKTCFVRGGDQVARNNDTRARELFKGTRTRPRCPVPLAPTPLRCTPLLKPSRHIADARGRGA